MGRFDGKVALVTGAGSERGIGKATALALASEGAHVVLTDVDAAGVERAAADVGTHMPALGVVADVRSKADMTRAVAQAVATFGGLDLLVNNAGATRPTKVLDITEDEYDFILGVNLKGTFITTQCAVPAMLRRGKGAIVSLSSVSGQRGGGVFGTSHYSAAKAGIAGLTRALARELTPQGIRINCVAPSLVGTDLFGSAITEERKTELASGTLTGRIGTVEDVVNGLLFLLDDRSEYLTGVTLDINGGSHLH